MEILNYLKDHLHIDYVIVLIVIGAGFFGKRFLRGFTWSKDNKTDEAYKTFTVSFVVSIVYLYLLATPKELWAQYFLSYFLATSLYELIVRPIVKRIQKALGAFDDENKKE